MQLECKYCGKVIEVDEFCDEVCKSAYESENKAKDKPETFREILVKHSNYCWTCYTNHPSSLIRCAECPNVAETVSSIQEVMPVEMANTKIAPAYDKYYIGYNEAIAEMSQALGLEAKGKGKE